jgi:hypothetical protein
MMRCAPAREQIIVLLGLALVAMIIIQHAAIGQTLAKPPQTGTEKPGLNLHKLPAHLQESTTLTHTPPVDYTNITPMNTAARKSFLTYQNNSTLGIKIQYPSNWKELQADDIGIIFISPPESTIDSFLEKLTLAVFPSNSNASINELANQAINNYREHLINFQLVESNGITFKSNPAYTLVYTYTDQAVKTVIAMDMGLTKNNKVYVLSYSADPTEYSMNMPTIQKMIDSFETRPIILAYSSRA